MVTATWQGKQIAQSDATILIEGNHYFPPGSVNAEHLLESTHTSYCPWKGTAAYYDIQVSGETNPGAAWYYPEPKAEAIQIKGYIAFWKGVTIE